MSSRKSRLIKLSGQFGIDDEATVIPENKDSTQVVDPFCGDNPCYRNMADTYKERI